MGEDGQVPDPQPVVSPPVQRPKLYRSSSDRWIAGVCGGIAEHLGISSALVRLLMVLAVVAGPGVFVYGFFWVMTRPDTSATQGVPVARSRRPLTRNQVLLVIGAAGLAIGLGWVNPAGQLGRHLGFLLPVVAVAVGAFLAWSQLDASERSRWAGRSKRGRILAVARPVVGVVLATVGVVALATQGQGFDVVLTSALAAVAVLVGAAVIALPWVVRMWQGLQAEQTERIRATERADIAAHLHDSVLQTLALVQRRADDPATVIRLARSQERELREWLYADQNRSTDSLASAVTTVTHEVEDEHGIPIEVVVTGDRPMDDGGQALVKATREALLNAVRHGAPPVSVYVEVGPSGVEAFVRDHGPGFETTEIGDDRLGVRESILGRMRRHGGAAKIRRLESGTEIELTLPPLAGADGATPATAEAPASTAEAPASTAEASASTAEAPATEPRPNETNAGPTAPPTPAPGVREAQPTGGRTT
jgi:signal transduction histidine kinase/phage shock protein PspC (stress-responsive transcriptional regulator)